MFVGRLDLFWAPAVRFGMARYGSEAFGGTQWLGCMLGFRARHLNCFASILVVYDIGMWKLSQMGTMGRKRHCVDAQSAFVIDSR